jgi:HPt (histidine-containing phosphotransfer) domain-containing protein
LIQDHASLEKFVDLPDLLARVEDDRELLAELFRLFQEQLPGFQDALHRAIVEGDLFEIVNAAHAIKGMLANLSMRRGASLAATIEGAARAGDMTNVHEALVAFDPEIAALSTAVDLFVSGIKNENPDCR